MEGQHNQQQAGQPNPAQTWYAILWEALKEIYEYYNNLAKAIGALGSFISLLLYFLRIMNAVENLTERMNSGFKDIEHKLDLVNKEILVVNKEVSVTNKRFEGKLGLIEGGLKLVNREIAIRREPAVEKGFNLENWSYIMLVMLGVVLVVLLRR